jgi:hypothetical protein
LIAGFEICFDYAHSRVNPFNIVGHIIGHGIRRWVEHAGSCWAMLGYVGPCWAMLGHAGPCWAMLGHAGPCWAMLGHAGPYWAMLGHAGPCWARLSHAGPLKVVHVGACWIMLSFTGSCWTMLDHAGHAGHAGHAALYYKQAILRLIYSCKNRFSAMKRTILNRFQTSPVLQPPLTCLWVYPTDCNGNVSLSK